ncbi:HemK2/MTQ2 family protein methyltransferase [Halalkalicoccus jeotgali]|uniref:Methylase n=1 Tax=Halalkalicoccus jeotgali (strain DSM 18796 / CECT 7217 / JCM 14584 / KCTC 4019 / B3) TaxID=795797 RepID=D8J303_HALJB|nr:HemK2/MTQ2 family protein methyltransferase [Halalkalicoccus jeotgali]ADJ15110.1 methylase [Halalkalicoccus jeotgali B3]ELY34870.1 methyltransferase [Halalkalicoccus jeotgali B3]
MTRDLADRRGVETEVYGAAEDSELLAGAAADLVGSGWTVLDCGTGSGHVGVRMRKAGARVIASDLNPHACERAREAGLEAVRGDLLDPFRSGVFDAVAFNPPYLPTEPETEWDDWMEVALSGGQSGRAVIEPFLDGVGRVLAPDGIALLLVSSLTGYESVLGYAGDRGFETSVVAEESFPFETLSVVALTR